MYYCRCCSNYIFILHLTLGFNILRKDNCKPRWETFKFSDLVRLILDTLRYLTKISLKSPRAQWVNLPLCSAAILMTSPWKWSRVSSFSTGLAATWQQAFTYLPNIKTTDAWRLHGLGKLSSLLLMRLDESTARRHLKTPRSLCGRSFHLTLVTKWSQS